MSASPDTGRRLPAPGTAATLLSAFFIALLLYSPALGEDFSIGTFRAEIEVRSDSTLLVKETIEAIFTRQRHGIYRDIPFRYVDELGEKTVMPLRVVSVGDESGKEWQYKVERIGGSLRIRIGDPEQYVDGRQIYVITYTVGNAVGFFPDHDELYWNVTGNEWPVPIASASAVVALAAGSNAPGFRTRCFTGPRGSREEACRASLRQSGATFISGRELRPGEGMTIVLGWDKGIVRKSADWNRESILFALNPRENWIYLPPALTLCIMLFLWYRKGKDPGAGEPLVVAYAPPAENERPLLPAEVGVLMDERLDPNDITASVVHLAVNRYVTIEERKTPGILFDDVDYVIRKEKEPGAALTSFERLLMERLFMKGGSEVRVSDLKMEFYKNLDDLRKAAFEGLERLRYFAANPIGVKSAYVRAGGVVAAGALVLGWLGEKAAGIASIGGFASIVISGLIVVLFAPLMPVKTVRGVKALGRVKGFEEFLLRAEKDRLERMSDANLFEKYLPYAIALGVSERWAKAFEGIYQEAPLWYVSGDRSDAFRPSSFHRSLGSALSTMSGAMQAAPRGRGSGFSGGGSSGGGGGGGGGGSW